MYLDEAPKAETIEMLNNVVVVMSTEGTIEDLQEE